MAQNWIQPVRLGYSDLSVYFGGCSELTPTTCVSKKTVIPSYITARVCFVFCFFSFLTTFVLHGSLN